MADYLTYENIYDEVATLAGDLNAAWQTKAKYVVNMVVNEIMNCDDLYPLHWMRCLIDDVKTKSAATLTGITKADPGVVTAAAHGFADGDVVQFGTVTGMTELSNRLAVVTSKADDSFSLYDLQGSKISTSSYGAVGTAGTVYHRGVTASQNITKINSFAWRGYNGQVKPVSMGELEENTSWFDTGTTSRPQRHHHMALYAADGTECHRLLWFTLPNTNYYARIWGQLRHARLSATTDVVQIPSNHHDLVVTGCMTRLVEYPNVQAESAISWPGLYKEGLAALKSENRAWWKDYEKPNERSKPYLL